MGLTYNPIYKVTANDNDITAAIQQRFSEMTITDETGFISDTFEIVLTDTDPSNPIKIPPTGAQLQVWIGYGGDSLTYKGMFIADEIELSDSPDRMTIRSHAAPFDQTPKGMLDFQSQKTRSWPSGTTIGAMVTQMASEHGMTGATSPELQSVQLPHIDQTAESDINFLIRLAKKYDAIAKPAGGKLIFAKRGNAQTVSGANLPQITVTRPDTVPGTVKMTQSTKESPGTVVAFYRDVTNATRHQVSVGNGLPVKRIRAAFKNKAMAQAAIEAELARRARGQYKLSFTILGRADITAESNLTMDATFRDGIAGDWVVERVVSRFQTQAGWRCEVEAEKPNDDANVEDVEDESVTDTGLPNAA
jgi:phage protein D